MISDDLIYHLPSDRETILTSKAVKSYVSDTCRRTAGDEYTFGRRGIAARPSSMASIKGLSQMRTSSRIKNGKMNTALNAICPYFTMFPLEFPYRILDRYARQGDAVLDPFAGRGTTLYAARLLGLNAFGIDSNPVAVAISESARGLCAATAAVCGCRSEAAGDDCSRLERFVVPVHGIDFDRGSDAGDGRSDARGRAGVSGWTHVLHARGQPGCATEGCEGDVFEALRQLLAFQVLTEFRMKIEVGFGRDVLRPFSFGLVNIDRSEERHHPRG